MRCLSCDGEMTDRDTSRKFVGSGTYVDLCQHCFETIQDQVEVTEKKKAKDIPDDDVFDFLDEEPY